MFYAITLSALLAILTNLIFVFSSLNMANLKPPKVYEEKPKIENIQADFQKVFKNYITSEKDASDIKLIAIASGAKNIALISHNGQIKTVKIGDKVGSYEVKEIMRNYLIISKDGQKKILSYPLISNETANPKAVTQSSEFSKKEIERLTKDPGVLFQEIRLKPSVEEGKTRGFIFEWIKPRSIFDKAGIKQGDVLVAINNIEIKSGEDSFRILQALRNESSLKVTLLRDGQNMDINLRVE